MTDPADANDIEEEEPSITEEPDDIHDLIGDAEAATAVFEEELLSASRLYSNDNNTNDDATIDTDIDTAAADAAAVAQGLLLDDAEADDPSGTRILSQSSHILLEGEDASPSPIRAMHRSIDDSQPSSHYYSVLNATQMIMADSDADGDKNKKNNGGAVSMTQSPPFQNFSTGDSRSYTGHSIYSSGTTSSQQQSPYGDPTGATPKNHPLRRRRRDQDPIAALASGSNRDPPATNRAIPQKPTPQPPQLHSWPIMQRTVLDFWTQTQTKPSPQQLTDSSYIRHAYLTMGGRDAWDCYCASFQGTDLHGLKPRDVSRFHHTYLQTLREAQTHSTSNSTLDYNNRSSESPSTPSRTSTADELSAIDSQRRRQPQSPSYVAVTSSDDDEETHISSGNSNNTDDDLERQRQPQQREDYDSSYLDTTMDVSTLTASFDPAGIGVIHDDSYYYHLYQEQHQQSDEDVVDFDGASSDLQQSSTEPQPLHLADDEPAPVNSNTATAFAKGAMPLTLSSAPAGNTTENGTAAPPPLTSEPRSKDWCRDQARRERGLVVCLLIACIVVSIIIGVVVPRLKQR